MGLEIIVGVAAGVLIAAVYLMKRAARAKREQ
jgi:MFS superfamily sulfate permease-like transporter